MYGTKLAQMPNDLPMGLGERLPRAEEVRAANIARKEDSNARYREAFFEKVDWTLNHELAKLQNDEGVRRQAEAREAEKNPPKAPWAPASPSEIVNGFSQIRRSYNAAGGCALNLYDLVNSFSKEKGSFSNWTPSLLAECKQFAARLGEEELARARSKVKIGNAPEFDASGWDDIDV